MTKMCHVNVTRMTFRFRRWSVRRVHREAVSPREGQVTRKVHHFPICFHHFPELEHLH